MFEAASKLAKDDSEAARTKALKKIFVKADKSKTGALNLDEFKNVLEHLDIELKDEDEVLDLMACFDVTNDGDISYTEFISFMVDEPLSEAFEVFVDKVQNVHRNRRVSVC